MNIHQVVSLFDFACGTIYVCQTVLIRIIAHVSLSNGSRAVASSTSVAYLYLNMQQPQANGKLHVWVLLSPTFMSDIH